ncbi:hypothetical protein KI248_gp56 [Mycobacterium phage Phaded]|uniref:Uncharacterized protein n=1 Tax=Mycobacterium phage Phaded TaxID=2686088 RepID=A0A6B9JB15_9CAUD|nr:hypothetical protein KI248_gp56 [Mycobacterium phage Phaded]QGZ16843.1 hypothetical protein SEA_PHADED_43 [Mycobacterium phage Phaded]
MLGTKFAGLQEFTAEMVDAVGMRYIKLAAMDHFRFWCDKHPEVIVPFEHTFKQDHRYDLMTDRVIVRTQAHVIRAQLAIEGPK